MTRKYDLKVNEAIWALLCDHRGQISAAEIRRQILADSDALGLASDIPLRTVQQKVLQLKKDRGVPFPMVEQGQEGKAIDAVYRRSIEYVDRQVTRLEKMEREDAPHDAKHLGFMRETTRAVVALKTLEKNPAQSKQGRAGKARHHGAKPATFLDRIGRHNDGDASPAPTRYPAPDDGPAHPGSNGEAKDNAVTQGDRDEAGDTMKDTQPEVEADANSPNRTRMIGSDALASRLAELVET